MYRSEKLLIRLLNSAHDPNYRSIQSEAEVQTQQGGGAQPQAQATSVQGGAQSQVQAQSARSEPKPVLGESCTYRMKEANELFFNFVFDSSKFYGLFPIDDPKTTTVVMGDFNDHSRFLYKNENMGKSPDGIASLITDGFKIGDTVFPGHKKVYSKPMDKEDKKSLVDTEAAPTCCRFARNGTFRSQSDAIFVKSTDKSETPMRVHGIIGENDEFPAKDSSDNSNELTKVGFDLPNFKMDSKLYKPNLEYDPSYKSDQQMGTIWYKVLTQPPGEDISESSDEARSSLGRKLKGRLDDGERKIMPATMTKYGIQSSDLNMLTPTDYIASSKEKGAFYVMNTDSYNYGLIKAMNEHIENYYSTERMSARPLDLISDHLKVSMIRDNMIIVSVNISSVMLMMYTKAYNELNIADPKKFAQAVVKEYVTRGGYLGTESIAAMYLITKGRDFMMELYQHVADFAAKQSPPLDFLIGVQEATLEYFEWFVSNPANNRPAPTVLYTQSGPEGSALIFGGDKFAVPPNSQFRVTDAKYPRLYLADYNAECWKKPMARKWKPKEGDMPVGATPLDNDRLKDIIKSKHGLSSEGSVTLSVSELASLDLPSDTKITAETIVEVDFPADSDASEVVKKLYVPDSFTWQENIRDDPWTVWNGGRTALITPLVRKDNEGQVVRHLNVLNVHSFNPSSDAAKMTYDEIEKFVKSEPPRDLPAKMELDMFD